jgi:hypothetical protein
MRACRWLAAEWLAHLWECEWGQSWESLLELEMAAQMAVQLVPLWETWMALL